MEQKKDALLLRSENWGESAKLVTLLTADGKLTAAMKGVRKAGAKLSFAAQPFCFAEYVFVERCGRYTVIEASLHEGFYGLRKELKKYYAAATVTSVCDAFAREGMECGRLLVDAVEAIGNIEAANEAPMSELLVFILQALRFAGYPVTTGVCPVCGKKLEGRRYFDMENGSFGCSACAVGVPASASTYDAIEYFGQHGPLAFSELADDGAAGAPTADGVMRALRLMRSYVAYQTDYDLRALADFLSL